MYHPAPADDPTNLNQNKWYVYVIDILVTILNLFFVVSVMILIQVQLKNVCAGKTQNERLATNSRRDQYLRRLADESATESKDYKLNPLALDDSYVNIALKNDNGFYKTYGKTKKGDTLKKDACCARTRSMFFSTKVEP
jgi:hypothetical protein